MVKNRFKHLISVQDFSKEEILFILKVIERMDKQQSLQINRNMMRGRTLGILCGANNLRDAKTEIIKLAMHKLGGSVIERHVNDIN